MSLPAFLATVVEALDDAGLSYMLTGSLAAAYYATPRATQDFSRSEFQRRDALQLLERRWVDLDRSYVERWIDELALKEEWRALLARAGR